MRPLIADTFYWIALLNRRDAWYRRVVAFSRTLGIRAFVTTEWVLAEFLAFYSAAGEVTRQRAAAKTREILQDPRIQVLSPSQALFLDGLALYESRLDKQYSLTECISMLCSAIIGSPCHKRVSDRTAQVVLVAKLLWTMALPGGIIAKDHNLLPQGDTLAMTRCTPWLRSLLSFACVLFTLLCDAGRFLCLCLRPSPAMAAEIVFLR